MQNGESCAVDTSTVALVKVDPLSVGGTLSPLETEVCIGQNKGAFLNLGGAVGEPVTWQSSTDDINWTDLTPTDTSHTYGINNITGNTEYRVIVQSGVCPQAISTEANVALLPVDFPVANIDPADTLICYGTKANLNADITIGTSFSWDATGTLTGPASGSIPATPYTLNEVAAPDSTTMYILTMMNTGCPNPLVDTFLVRVYPPIIVHAGNDTNVVIGQPLQFNASSNDIGDTFTWTPATDLSNPDIPNPIGVYTAEIDTIRYIVTATASNGCTGDAGVTVHVFTTLPDIFVPTGFTPGLGIDNIFRPILVGISSLQFFRVYNRYGQLVYTTNSTETGWDGRVNGQPQPAAAYVWEVEGTSYLGKVIFKKGTVVLMR